MLLIPSNGLIFVFFWVCLVVPKSPRFLMWICRTDPGGCYVVFDAKLSLVYFGHNQA